MIPDINLLPKMERRSGSHKWIILISSIIFGLLLVFLITQYVTLTKSIKILGNEEQTLVNQKIEIESILASLEEPEGVDLEESVKFIESVSYPVSPLVIEINRYLGVHSYLRSYTFTEESVQFEVDFETMSEVVLYLENLMGSAYFNDVLVDQITTFNPVSSDEEDEKDLEETVDRYSNTFEVLIDLDYLKAGGGEE